MRHFGQTHLIATVKQAVRILDSDDTRQIVFIRQVQIAHYAKGRFVRDANVADFSRALALGQRFQRFQQRYGGGTLIPAVAELTKAVGWALRPVHLIQVEVVGLQALQAGVQCGADILTIEDLIRADPGIVVARGTTDF